MKIITKVLLVLIILVLSVVLVSFDISGFIFNNSSLEYPHSWTKAICNETHCQDYIIECEGEVLIEQKPITGAVIRIPEDWEDPRNETMRNRTCEVI